MKERQNFTQVSEEHKQVLRTLLREENALRLSSQGQQLYKKFDYDEATKQIRDLVYKRTGVNPVFGERLLLSAIFILSPEECSKLANYLAGSLSAVPKTQLEVNENVPVEVQVVHYKTRLECNLKEYLSNFQDCAIVLLALSGT